MTKISSETEFTMSRRLSAHNKRLTEAKVMFLIGHDKKEFK